MTLPSHSTNDINSLTLPNGMTAGVGPDLHANPPLGFKAPGKDVYGGNPALAPLRQGLMRTAPGVASDTTSGFTPPYVLYFHFNPNQVAVSLTTNLAQVPVLTLVNGLIPNIPNALQFQTVSWSLFFDRTYDMWYDPNPGANRGVLNDIGLLYNIIGLFESNGNTPILNAVQVQFGKVQGSGAIWGFTGFITGVNITYGIFRYDMMPSRCQVDLTMTAVYIPQTAPTDGGGSGGASTGSTTGSNGSPLNLGTFIGGTTPSAPPQPAPSSGLQNLINQVGGLTG